MKKALLVLSLSITVISSLFAQNKIYSCRYFSIEYPSNWTTVVVGNLNATTSNLVDAVLTIKPKNINQGELTYNIAINMDPSIDWSGINQTHLVQLKNSTKSQYSKVTFITEPEFITYKSLSGIMMEYTANMGPITTRMRQYIIHKRNGFTYFLNVCVDNSKVKTQMSEVMSILDSMEIL